MYYFIVNTHSRSGKGWGIWDELKSILEENKVSYKTFITEYPAHARVLAREVQEMLGADDIIVVMGGDGSLNEVIDGLDLAKKTTIGFIPTGSGNDFARGLQLSEDPRGALINILKSNEVKTIDIGKATFTSSTDDKEVVRKFCVSSGFGYDAAVCYDINKSVVKKIFNAIHLGKLSFFVIGVKQWLAHPKTGGTISVDGEKEKRFRKLDFLSCHNLPYEGGGYPFAPGANPSDGLLSICVVAIPSRLKYFAALILSKNIVGIHTRFKGTKIINCANANIKLDKPLHVHTDGEVHGKFDKISYSIQKDAIDVIM